MVTLYRIKRVQKGNINFVGKIFYWLNLLLCAFRIIASGIIVMVMITGYKSDEKENSTFNKILLDMLYIP